MVIQIQIKNGDISLSTDTEIRDGEELIAELIRVLCAAIAIYKYRLERVKEKPLTPVEESVLNQRIKDNLFLASIENLRDEIIVS